MLVLPPFSTKNTVYWNAYFTQLRPNKHHHRRHHHIHPSTGVPLLLQPYCIPAFPSPTAAFCFLDHVVFSLFCHTLLVLYIVSIGVCGLATGGLASENTHLSIHLPLTRTLYFFYISICFSALYHSRARTVSLFPSIYSARILDLRCPYYED